MNLIHICATIYVDIVSKPLGQVLQELKLLVGKLFFHLLIVFLGMQMYLGSMQR